MAETRIESEDILDLSIRTEDIASGAVHPANVNLSASWDYTQGTLIYDKIPTTDGEVASKAYVDAAAAGARDPKDAVLVAASGSIALTGTLAIDGVQTAVGDRVLAFGQASAAENGIYVVRTGAWERAADANGDPTTGSVTNGMYTLVASGVVWEGVGFLLTTPDPITVGTTPLTFVQYTALGKVVAGAGLTKTGNQLDVGAGYGIEILPDAVQVDGAVVADKTGSNTWTGDNVFSAGLTGSLQQVAPGQSYLVAGTNVNIVSQSNGSIVISVIDNAGDADWTDLGGALTTTSSVNIENTLSVLGPVTSTLGFSGSLTTLADGSSYLVQGEGILITSQSNGSVTVAINSASIVTLDRHVYGERITGSFPGKTFETKFPFASGTLRVYRRGLRMTEGPTEDYVIDTNQRFTMKRTTRAGANLQVDYIKAN